MKKVLIIDDDSDIREVLMTILENTYEVREAKSKAEGTQMLEAFIPDLIVLDVMMENLDSGFEMAREIRKDAQLQDVKILMLTNADREMDMDFKKFAGDEDWLPVEDYVLKPIEPQIFLAKVKKLIGA